MEATDKTNNVDDTVDRLRSGAHSTVDKVANATTQAAEALGQKCEQLKNVEQQSLRDRSRVVPRSDSVCVFTKRFLRSENAGFTKSRRVIA